MTASAIGRTLARSHAHVTGRAQLLAAACAVLGLAVFLSLSIGPTGLTLMAVPDALSALMGHAGADEARAYLVLVDLRLPRTLLGMFVGAALAIAGAMMQGLFRNPLADPGLIGVSSGAALAAVTMIAFGHQYAANMVAPFGTYALPVAAFVGGLATTAVLVVLASRSGDLSVGTLLLSGIAIAAFTGALTGFVAQASDDRALRDITLWQLGSLSGASWEKVAAIVPFAMVLAAGIPRTTRALNGLLLGEAEAFHLGIDVRRAKYLVIVLTAAAVGAAVATAGVIGFVGIVVPHVVRLLAGADHRIVLPGSALLGAALVLACDLIARMVVTPAEWPLGMVMAALGGPVFLYLVLKRGAGGAA